MKKAVIATLHSSYNEGAILQAYALSRLIEEYLGIEAEIIDHRYPAKEAIYGVPASQREMALSEAIETWLPLSSNQFRTNDCTPTFRHISKHNAVLFVGSDQVWSLKYRRRLRRILGRGIFATQPYGFYPAFPNIYWPDSKVSVPKISYAAAVGRYEWQGTPTRHRQKMARILDGFKLVSVRDERSLRFLNWIDPSIAANATIVPDPTLAVSLLDQKRVDALRSRLIGYGVDFNRRRCGVVCANHEETAKFAAAMKKKDFQLIAITTPNSFCEVNLFDKPFHPLDWALLFGMMDVCVVERMHAAIFCLHNGTPFVLLDINETPHDYDTKSTSLMKRFGLIEFCLGKKGILAEGLIDATIGCLENNVQRTTIPKVLNQMRVEARDFIIRCG